jgi:hypothetical protein
MLLCYRGIILNSVVAMAVADIWHTIFIVLS